MIRHPHVGLGGVTFWTPGGGVLLPYRSGVGPYPRVAVFDMANQLRYRGEAPETFADSFTYANTGGAPLEMVDSDGVTKTQPHNFLLQSSDLTSTWLTGGSLTIDGEDQVTYMAATADNLRQFVEPPLGPTYTTSLDIWSTTDAGEQVQAQLIVTGAPNGLFNITLASEATRVSFDTETDGGTGALLWRLQNNVDGLAKVVHVDNLCLHQSPMVLNPDTGTDCVPTTTDPIFLPRLSHYADLGSGLENAGLLLDTANETFTLDVDPGVYDVEVVSADGAVTRLAGEVVTDGFAIPVSGVISYVGFFPLNSFTLAMGNIPLTLGGGEEIILD
jgi:hypothetical protein